MDSRRIMTIGDWLNSAALLVIGVYLGLALEKLFQLDGVAFWVVGIGIPIIFGGVLLFGQLFDGLTDRLFPSGVKRIYKPQTKKRRPLALLLALPIGIIIGVAGAQFGLSEMIL